MKIGYISERDVHDVKSWSGTIYNTYRALCEFYGDENIFICRRNPFIYKLSLAALKVSGLFRGKTEGRSRMHSWLKSRSYKRSDLNSADVLFAPAGSLDIAYMKTRTPIIYMSDATFERMIDYYEAYSQLGSNVIATGNMLEARALENSAHFIASSQWAAESAIGFYAVSPAKVSVIKLPASIPNSQLRKQRIREQGEKTLNVLFMGVDWKRKGGDIAVECCKELIRLGVELKLHIVGIRDLEPQIAELGFVSNWGFLDKQNPEHAQTWLDIVSGCDLLLLPTRAECAGLVFTEAAAYGLPSLTYKTGGTGDYVMDGLNGYTLDMSATPSDFATKLMSMIQNCEISAMKESSQRIYKECFTREAWASQFDRIARSLISE